MDWIKYFIIKHNKKSTIINNLFQGYRWEDDKNSLNYYVDNRRSGPDSLELKEELNISYIYYKKRDPRGNLIMKYRWFRENNRINFIIYDCLPDGIYPDISWDSSGNIRYIKIFKHKNYKYNRHGICIDWHDLSNVLKSIEYYKNGDRKGKTYEWDIEGKLIHMSYKF